MDDLNLLKEIEILNREIIRLKYSDEYVIGKKVCRFVNEMKQGKFFLQFERFLKNRKIKNIREVSKKENVTQEEWERQLKFGDSEKKFVVYSCITGGYDIPCNPLFCRKSSNYVMFTDAPLKDNSVWEYKSIPEKLRDMSRSNQNRYIKMHPFDLFENADYACYIDGNVCPVSDLSIYTDVIEPSAGFAMHYHSTRDCIYEERKACEALKKGNLQKISSQIKLYEEEGFPQKYGMLECNMFVVDLHNPVAKKIFQMWWDELNRSQSGRDQIALPYVLWKNNIAVSTVAKLGESIYKNPKLMICEHK